MPGADPHWLDGSNPNTAPGTGEIEVATGTTTSNVALGLVRFDLSYGVPIKRHHHLRKPSIDNPNHHQPFQPELMFLGSIKSSTPRRTGALERLQHMECGGSPLWMERRDKFSHYGGGGLQLDAHGRGDCYLFPGQFNPSSLGLEHHAFPCPGLGEQIQQQLWGFDFARTRDKRNAFGVYFLLGQHREQPAETKDAGHLHHSIRRNSMKKRIS